MRVETIYGSQTLKGAEGLALRVEVSRRMAERHEAKLERRVTRLSGCPERLSVAKAMFAVEQRIVEAYWVLGRSTTSPGPRRQSQHGIEYMLERDDKWGAAVAGGGWLNERPAPPPATSQEVDRADRALEWLVLLDKQTASVVAAGARSKQGDAKRRVNWIRVRNQLPNCALWSASMLHRTYKNGLRIIASEFKDG